MLPSKFIRVAGVLSCCVNVQLFGQSCFPDSWIFVTSEYLKCQKQFNCISCIAWKSSVYRYAMLTLAIRLSNALDCAGRRPLRSNLNDIRKLFVPRTHNKFGDRSFSAAGPRLWNDLPPGLQRPGLTFDSFKKSLKTHLFGDRSLSIYLRHAVQVGLLLCGASESEVLVQKLQSVQNAVERLITGANDVTISGTC